MALRVTCRDCSEAILAADVNVGEGVAFCRACNSLIRLADIVEDDQFDEVDLAHRPRGGWDAEGTEASGTFPEVGAKWTRWILTCAGMTGAATGCHAVATATAAAMAAEEMSTIRASRETEQCRRCFTL